MKEKESLISLLLILLCFYTAVLFLKEIQMFSLFEHLFTLGYKVLIALCFVLLFEPIIERLHFKKRALSCTVVYLVLLVMVTLIGVLIVPVIVNEWDRLTELFAAVQKMGSTDAEMAFSYESAMTSTLSFLKSFADLAVSYLMAFFISLEFDELKNHLSQSAGFKKAFEFYDEFKEVIFQYVKALVLDISLLFLMQTIVLLVFDVDYAVSLAFGLAVLNIIPYFGATLGQILIFLVDYLVSGEFHFVMILCVFAVQQVESNCLQPMLYGRMMNLKPLYMFISILFFGTLMGMTGVLFAPIFAVAIQFFLQRCFQHRNEGTD